ncbi:MAG: T9SS type A sorting domain-containing protein [Sphingobacteriales bacterium JAD_PAG50586_3]|nr:MAG: T9SS type A sorting domain-containing protein [Sphingobacteriales bacterium JAD_PAG50586_3]
MKVKLLFASALIAMLAIVPASAQDSRNCGTTEYHQHQLDTDPQLAVRMADIESFTNNYVSTHTGQEKAIVTIPVVFHVVYNTTAQNISDARILAQLDQLNQDFARLNADAGNTPAAFQGLAANTQIQFCLAQRDPSGNPTTGIERRQTTVTSFSSNDAVKYNANGGLNAWNSSQYLNIWSCNLGSGLLGYAQFPGGSAATDGVVCLFSSIGSLTVPGTATNYNYGRTMTHEVGHWLNLRHIWGDANCGSDLVSDTPTQQTSNSGCPAFPRRTCGNTTNGDMFMNYMDYTYDACMNMFTTGQSARMAALFATGGARVSLLSSQGCVPVQVSGCGVPSSLTASNITTTSATLGWAAVSGATAYNLQYKLSSATSWTPASTTTNSFALAGLTAGSAYQFQVQAVCGETSSNYSAAATFTTLSNTTCTDTYESNETRTTSKVIATNSNITAKIGSTTDKDWFRFSTTSSARNIRVTLDQLPADYDIRLYNSNGSQLAISQNSGTTAESITRNTTSTGTYYLQVYGYNGANSATCYRLRVDVSSSSFKTLSGADEEEVIDMQPVDALSLFPNPTNGNFTVSLLSDNENDALVRVFDITGKAVVNTRFAATKGQNLFNLDLTGNAHGIYFVEVNQGATRLVKKLIVE